MPIIIKPSTSNDKIWGRFVLLPLQIELVNLPILFITLLFGLVNAVQANDNYTDPTNGRTNSPTDSQATAIFILLNVLTPLVALLVSFINLYLYTSHIFHPALSLTTSLILLGGWATVLTFQGFAGPEGLWGWFNSRGLYVSTGVWIVMLVGGILAGCLCFTQMCISAHVIRVNKKAQRGLIHLDSDDSSSEQGA